uniref:zinc finger BED domain-containing protein 5-like n=1 Tax=Myxine glutinosa TaxID=7769 RepID=UPI003590028F
MTSIRPGTQALVTSCLPARRPAAVSGPSEKRLRLMAQRKFAQAGSCIRRPFRAARLRRPASIVPQSSVQNGKISDQKDGSGEKLHDGANHSALMENLPCTEDFLTFLCLRGTAAVPATIMWKSPGRSSCRKIGDGEDDEGSAFRPSPGHFLHRVCTIGLRRKGLRERSGVIAWSRGLTNNHPAHPSTLARLSKYSSSMLTIPEVLGHRQGLTKASYLVAEKIAKEKKSYTIAKFDMFENLDDLLSKSVEERVDIKDVIVEHLVNLRKRFDEYFPVDPRVEKKWIRDPYSVDVQQCCNLSNRLKEDLIDIVSDGTLETLFRKDTLVKFWLTVSHEYPEIAHLAVKFLMLFTTTWMWEAGFSTMTYLKSKSHKICQQPSDG